MKKQNPTPITSKSFSFFQKLDDWTVLEIPSECWSKMDYLPRPDDLIAVYASGCQLQYAEMHGQLVSTGMDIVAIEQNPKPSSIYGPEPVLNIYHMVFQKLKREYDEYQFLAYGPFNTGALQDHWPKNEEKALEYYCNFGTLLD